MCGATGPRAGRETSAPRAPRGHPALPGPGRSETAVSARLPTFPGLNCIFLWGSHAVSSAQSGKLRESLYGRKRRFRFRKQVSFSALMIFTRASLTLRHGGRGAPAAEGGMRQRRHAQLLRKFFSVSLARREPLWGEGKPQPASQSPMRSDARMKDAAEGGRGGEGTRAARVRKGSEPGPWRTLRRLSRLHSSLLPQRRPTAQGRIGVFLESQ